MIANVLVFILGVSNILLLLLVFTVMARPHYMLPLMRRFFQASEASDEVLLRLAIQSRWLGLFLLFCWSFCCSALIVYAKIFLS